MQIRIVHETAYKFSSSVFLEPHYFRFKPKNTQYNKLESFSLTMSPEPAGCSEQYDPEENPIQLYWFEGLHSQLKIHAESLVSIRVFNPFNFLVHPSSAAVLPFNYPEDLRGVLNPLIQHSGISEILAGYAEIVKKSAGGQTIGFITGLTEKIHADFIVEARQEGQPFEPELTYRLKKGSCRDLSWMAIQILRSMGIASRFVSGYYHIPSEKQEPELHAWVEAYIPGVGWFGIDPSNGIVTGSGHIPLAASAHYRNTMPVTGTVRGQATSELTTMLSMDVVE